MYKINVRQFFTENNLVIENEYFKEYCELIDRNLVTSKQDGKTQKHHIIPKAYFKQNNLEINNSKENLVNLLYVDHLKAHCCLALCLKDSLLAYKMFLAANKLLGSRYVNDLEEFKLLCTEDLLIYQEAYEENREFLSKYNPMKAIKSKDKHDQIMRSDIVRDKIFRTQSLRRKNKCMLEMHRGDVAIRVDYAEVAEKLRDGWRQGPQGTNICFYDGIHVLAFNSAEILEILPEQMPIYKVDGYRFSAYYFPKIRNDKYLLPRYGSRNTDEHKISIPKNSRVRLHKDNREITISKSKLEQYLNEGWELGRKSRVFSKNIQSR